MDNKELTRNQVMEFMRSDSVSKLSADDCAEIFATILKGESDLSVELFNEILSDYNAEWRVKKDENYGN